MERLCVFCGSSPGRDPAHAASARALGELLARRGIALVYGGAGVGLMGALADAVLGAGGRVIGVIPRAMVEREVAHTGLTERHVVGSMHERKALMSELADGFAALPGGLGTLEELFEVLTWAQLGLHRKPCGLLDAGGYFDHLVRFLDRAVAEGFLRPEHRRLLVLAGSPEELLEGLGRHVPPVAGKWLDLPET